MTNCQLIANIYIFYVNFEGTFCETDIDECESQPCANGGKCTDHVNGYICQCRPNYVGTNCTELVDPCQQNPCMNGATCNSLHHHNTEHPIDDEESVNEKENDGTFANQIGYNCLCHDGFTGS